MPLSPRGDVIAVGQEVLAACLGFAVRAGEQRQAARCSHGGRSLWKRRRPDARPRGDALTPDSKRKTVSLQGRRVLVVEDDPSIAIGLRINLESEGYEVHVAED